MVDAGSMPGVMVIVPPAVLLKTALRVLKNGMVEPDVCLLAYLTSFDVLLGSAPPPWGCG